MAPAGSRGARRGGAAGRRGRPAAAVRRRRRRCGSRTSASARRVGRRDARLRRAEELVAALELRPALGVGRRSWSTPSRSTMFEPQHVPDVVQRVGGERLPVEVVPDRLHAGEAAAPPEMWVLSGAGGSVAAARASGSTARLRSSIVWRNWRSGLASAGRVLRRAGAARGPPGGSPATARRPTTEALPSASNAGRARLGERAQPRQEGVELAGEAAPGRAAPGCWACGQVAELRACTGSSSPRKAGRPLERLGQLRRAGSRRSRRSAPASRTKRLTSACAPRARRSPGRRCAISA